MLIVEQPYQLKPVVVGVVEGGEEGEERDSEEVGKDCTYQHIVVVVGGEDDAEGDEVEAGSKGLWLHSSRCCRD